MWSVIGLIGTNLHYQVFRFYAKTIYGAPFAPYELTRYLYRKTTPRAGWTYEEYMQHRQRRMNEAVDKVPEVYALKPMFVILIIALTAPVYALVLGVGVLWGLDRGPLGIAYCVLLPLLSGVVYYRLSFFRGDIQLYFRFFRIASADAVPAPLGECAPADAAALGVLCRHVLAAMRWGSCWGEGQPLP